MPKARQNKDYSIPGCDGFRNLEFNTEHIIEVGYDRYNTLYIRFSKDRGTEVCVWGCHESISAEKICKEIMKIIHQKRPSWELPYYWG